MVLYLPLPGSQATTSASASCHCLPLINHLSAQLYKVRSLSATLILLRLFECISVIVAAIHCDQQLAIVSLLLFECFPRKGIAVPLAVAQSHSPLQGHQTPYT